MKYAIISDIHSNLEALERTLSEIDDVGVDKFICLGDLVGYGANPNECVDLIREREIVSIAGNHDVVASGNKEPTNFNPIARDAILWARNELTIDNKNYLLNLPSLKDFGDFLIVHGSISDPDLYILSTDDALGEFNFFEEHYVCFFGHTHVRICYSFSGREVEAFYDHRFSVDTGKKYLVNPGSVGQPRDGDSRASFLIYDKDAEEIVFMRIDYDIETAQQKILNAGLDKRLAYRLSIGM